MPVFPACLDLSFACQFVEPLRAVARAAILTAMSESIAFVMLVSG
jgi:hypothetical protein